MMSPYTSKSQQVSDIHACPIGHVHYSGKSLEDEMTQRKRWRRVYTCGQIDPWGSVRWKRPSRQM